MNKEKEPTWIERKKNLPKNWCEIVSKSLSDKGFDISPSKVSDVRAGKIANINIQELVWSEIVELEKEYKQRKEKLSTMISV